MNKFKQILILLFIIIIPITRYIIIERERELLSHMRIIIKITKPLKINPWNKLTQKQGYELEKNCLQLLEQNYECICEKKKIHFPQIIKYDDKKFKLFLSINGISLNKYEQFLKLNVIDKFEMKSNIEKQVDCILHNLQKSKIKHFDLAPKNICINEVGTISLIDFDIASINDIGMSSNLQKRNDNYNYLDFRRAIINILSLIL